VAVLLVLNPIFDPYSLNKDSNLGSYRDALSETQETFHLSPFPASSLL
jgi:hypothetical protein